jgi:hypothetical protein
VPLWLVARPPVCWRSPCRWPDWRGLRPRHRRPAVPFCRRWRNGYTTGCSTALACACTAPQGADDAL